MLVSGCHCLSRKGICPMDSDLSDTGINEIRLFFLCALVKIKSYIPSEVTIFELNLVGSFQ